MDDSPVNRQELPLAGPVSLLLACLLLWAGWLALTVPRSARLPKASPEAVRAWPELTRSGGGVPAVALGDGRIPATSSSGTSVCFHPAEATGPPTDGRIFVS